MPDLVKLSDDLSPYSRCAGELLIKTAGGPKDAFGIRAQIELCPACDASKPAARSLIEFIRIGGGRDTSRTKEGADLLWAWTTEAMAEKGWQPAPREEPELSNMQKVMLYLDMLHARLPWEQLEAVRKAVEATVTMMGPGIRARSRSTAWTTRRCARNT